MKSAYREKDLYNLAVLKESRRWRKQDLISSQQMEAIREAHKCYFYHPNIAVRILLFLAGLIALSGVSTLIFTFGGGMGSMGLWIPSGIAAIVFIIALEKGFIGGSNHYKSGITEAILYLACGYTICAIAGPIQFNEHVTLLVCLIVLTGAAVRYLDLICTSLSVGALAGLLFFECYNLDGVFRQTIPFAFIIVFAIVYFLTKRFQKQARLEIWTNNLLVVESLSLLFIYAGGNYLVVRELSINLMGMSLTEGQDIPFAFVFYGLTVLIPLFYLYVAIRKKNVVLLRVGLVVLAVSAVTFNYYYGLERHEITLTIAGLALLVAALILFSYLKEMRGGFTREKLMGENWANANVAAFVVSQTLGGNQVRADESFKGGGGEFGGGGASGSF